MVRGLDVFRQYFAGHADQFVLIGGTAATLAMEEAGLEFRATKDLDIVLHIEALKPEFAAVFWNFVEAGDLGPLFVPLAARVSPRRLSNPPLQSKSA